MPGETPKVLIAYDDSSAYDQSFLSATDAAEVRSYIVANVAKGPEGAPEFRVLDVNADMSNEHPAWQEAMKAAKGKALPVALINGTKSNFDGPVPKGAKAMVEVLKTCFGEHKLPMQSQAPPEAYALNDDDFNPANRKTGLEARDFKLQPFGSLAFAPAYDLTDLDDKAIEDAIVQKDAEHSWLDDLRNVGMNGTRFPSLDQNGQGFCWCYSSGGSVLYIRAKNGQPFSSLSPHAIACKQTGFRDQGGWGNKSLEFIATKGIPSATFWPQKSMDRKYDNDKTWADAARHKVSKWMELEPRNKRQLATCLVRNIPVVVDFNWWSHSVCAVRLVKWGPNGANMSIRIQNSWSDSWSQNGLGDLTGSKAIPDGAVAPRVVVASYQRNDRRAFEREFRQAP